MEGAVDYHKDSAAAQQSSGYHDAIRAMIDLAVKLIAAVGAGAAVVVVVDDAGAGAAVAGAGAAEAAAAGSVLVD